MLHLRPDLVRTDRLDPDGGAGVAALVAENIDHQFRCGVDDHGLAGEIGRRIDKAAEADDPADPVQITARRFPDLGQEAQRGPGHDGVGPENSTVALDHMAVRHEILLGRGAEDLGLERRRGRLEGSRPGFGPRGHRAGGVEQGQDGAFVTASSMPWKEATWHG